MSIHQSEQGEIPDDGGESDTIDVQYEALPRLIKTLSEHLITTDGFAVMLPPDRANCRGLAKVDASSRE